jgi:hypothetical protein
VLRQAQELTHRDRQGDYGHPLDNHGRTATLWRAYLLARFNVDLELTPEDVCWLNAQQKMSRRMHAPTLDSITDVAGYAVNVAMVEDERERRNGTKVAGCGCREGTILCPH